MVEQFQKVNVGIVVAFKKEAQTLLERADKVERTNWQGFVVYLAEYCQRNIIIVVSGLGAKNSQVATNHLFKNLKSIKTFINIGFAGALTQFYDLGEVVQVGTVLDESGELVVNKIALVQSLPIVKLVYLKGPLTSGLARDALLERSEAECVDMESRGFLEALRDFKGKVSLLKVISDFANEESEFLISENAKAYSDQLEKALRGVYFLGKPEEE